MLKLNSRFKLLLSGLFCLACTACASAFSIPQANTPQTSADPNAIRIMPLGDSITQANGNHNSYRRSLWLKLKQAGYNVDFVGSTRSHYLGSAPQPDFDLDHEGHWGWRVSEVLNQIDSWARAANPDIVLLHLGTNNIGEPNDRTIADLKRLIQSLRTVNPRVTILLAQLIPIAGMESEVQQFNQAISQLAIAENTTTSPIVLVDQFTGFNASPTADTYDGVHPNATGEEKLASRWFQALQKGLPQRSKN